MKTFNDLKISQNIIDGLKKQGITSPTEIQSLVIENVLENKDLLVGSQTGSGKTLTYLLPMFEKIDATKRESQVVILAPTHELVMQIVKQIELLSNNSGANITTLPLIGEVNIQKQIKNIKSVKPHIVVGTCGRILDLIRQRKLKMHTVKTIILDEVDTLLTKNKTQVIEDIIKTTLRDRQLLGFSASITEETVSVCDYLMKDMEIVKTKSNLKVNPNINHMFLLGDQREKFTLLRKSIAATKPKKAIIFVNDEESIDIITSKLNYHNYATVGISGKLSKEERKNALNTFKIGKANILVSSDLSARGLDIVDITHVFNLDFPQNQNEYVHRCGRTARGNRKGDTISIITKRELSNIKTYKREFKINIRPKEVKEGMLVDYVSK